MAESEAHGWSAFRQYKYILMRMSFFADPRFGFSMAWTSRDLGN
jgi:hypothetical protein